MNRHTRAPVPSAPSPTAPPARHLLIYHVPLGEADGTSVMLRRLYAPHVENLLQLSFRAGRCAPPSDVRRVAIPGDFPWPFRRGAQWLRRLYPQFGMPLLATCSPQMRRARAAWRDDPGSVLVAVYCDAHAARARVLLRNWGIRRFVLMVMDLRDDTLPSPATTPAFCQLLRECSALITVSDRLGAQLRQITAAPQFVLSPPSGIAPQTARPHRDAPFRVLASGALYAGKGSFLETVFLPGWQAFAAAHPTAELLYVGTEAHKLPASLRPKIQFVGRKSETEFAELLAGVSVGVLPVAHQASSMWRFSVPARLSDYLAAGLPIIAPTCAGTATADFLTSLPAGIAQTTDDPATVERILTRLHDCPGERENASTAAIRYAREKLALATVRPVFIDWLQRHSAPATTS